MPDEKRELQTALDDFVKRNIKATIIPATVISVNESEYTCDVRDVEGNEIFDVRLRSIVHIHIEPGLVFVPEVDSSVLIGNIGDSENSFVVLAFSKVSKFYLKIGATLLEINQDGFLLQRNVEDLKTLMGDLLDAIKLITVTTPSGLSGVPVNVASFTALQGRFNQLLKN